MNIPDSVNRLAQTVNIQASRMPGQVALVGAGPGDPEMLTLKAAKAISQATVLLIDDLVNEEVLIHASPQARLIHVGKRGGCASTPQNLILKLMVQEAKKGEAVVRLKGGDPFIFGRGGEEVEYLQAAGITVTVINGITSGLAAASALNIPLTHRDAAHGVIFVTGHNKPGDAGINWAALSRSAYQAKLTMVIYMGVSSANSIAEGLMQGLPSNTPVAIVQNASLSTQRHAVCELRQLVATLTSEQLASPSVIIVGNVLSGIAQLQIRKETRVSAAA